jgi:Ca2+:H+ antiporter
MFAMKGKLDLTLGVAIGSSTQIAVFVLPFLVILGWILGEDLSLNFGVYEAISLLLSVLLVFLAIKDGTSNYLMGIILISCYLIISIGFAVRNDSSLSN